MNRKQLSSITALAAVTATGLAACEAPRDKAITLPDPVVIAECLLTENAFLAQLRQDQFFGSTEDADADLERFRRSNAQLIRRSIGIVSKNLRIAESEGRTDLIEQLNAYCAARADRGSLTLTIEREIARAAMRED